MPDFLRWVLRRTTCGEDSQSAVGKVATQKGQTQLASACEFLMPEADSEIKAVLQLRLWMVPHS